MFKNFVPSSGNLKPNPDWCACDAAAITGKILGFQFRLTFRKSNDKIQKKFVEFAMNEKWEEIRRLVYKFEEYGVFEMENNGAVLIGRPPHVQPESCLNCIFKPLTESQAAELERDLKTSIPKSYRDFLTGFANGLNIFRGVLALYGKRDNYNRTDGYTWQPFDLITPNIPERPENAKENYFFIGTYNRDGSNLYIDKETEKVYFCARWDATPLCEWACFEDMLLSEIPRIYTLYTDDGRVIDSTVSELPV